MRELNKGKYRARLASSEADVAATQTLRALVFRDGVARDVDAFDPVCDHMLVEARATGALVCSFRLMGLASGADVDASYSSQYYGLASLADHTGPMIEVGRFCAAPGLSDPDIMRIALGALTVYVDERGAGMMFGCSSFKGTEAALYKDTFALLRDRHPAPERWQPSVKAPEVVRFGEPGSAIAAHRPCDLDRKRAMLAMPPLLKTYLAMGGWVSDHAVVDRDLGTLHVFTGLEVAAIPAARKRLLRAVAS
ncbi:MAG: GNAT family N-acyltransferase [Pseudomonadota bacterium]